MKKTIIALMALSGVAMAADVTFELPVAQTVTNHQGFYGQTAEAVLNSAIGKGDGVWAGNNGGASNSMAGEKVGEEGYWSGDSITLAGRGGTQGESCAIILDASLDIPEGEGLQSITLAAVIDANSDINGKELEFGIGVWDASVGTYTQTAVNKINGSGTENVSVNLTLTLDDVFAWESGDKVVIVTNGPGFTPPANTYTVSGYKVTASTASLPIPEPTTATLSLLALAGLAARRRRR